MKKVLVITVYRYYFFGLFKKEIKIAYEVKNGKVIFERQLEKNEQMMVTYKYKEQ